MEYQPETLRKLHEIQLSILKDVDDLCTRHDITYFLDSGTALGAVRHNGFIPWDDDVDIGMLRPDYDRFLTVAKEELPASTYRLLIPGETLHYAAMFTKVALVGTKFYTQETIEAGLDMGIFIDVFPYDDLSSDEKTARRQLSGGRIWQSLSFLYHSGAVNIPHKGILGRIEAVGCHAVHRLLKATLSKKSIDSHFRAATTLPNQETPTTRCVAFSYPISGGFDKSRLLPTRKLFFEEREFPVPRDIEYYLEKLFGTTWQEMPPEDQRRNHAPVELELPRSAQ